MKALAGALGAYSLEVAILLSVLSAVYLLAVRPVRAPWVHRACIVGIYAVSLLAPLWVWLASGLWTVGEASAAGGTEVGLPVMVVAGDGGGKAASVGWTGILAGVLAAGMAVTLLLSLAGWWRVAAGILRGRRLRVEGWTLSLVADPKAPAYSWGRWIVCAEADFSKYGRMLVVHEAAHLRRLHWLDLLLAQAVTVVNWYNPAAWLLLECLRDAHEFTADSAVLRSGVEKREYVMMLIEKAVGKRVEVFANSLNHSQLKKRVTMMRNQKESAWRRLGVAAMLPALAAGVAFAAMPQVRGWLDGMGRRETATEISGKVSEIPVTGKISGMTRVDKAAEEAAPRLSQAPAAGGPEKKTAADEKKLVYYVDGKPFTGDIRSIPSDQIASMRVDKSGARPEIHITLKKGDAAAVDGAKVPDDFRLAEYEGGYQALREAIQKEMKYPEEALKAKVEGRAIVKLEINGKGEVESASIVKSAGDRLLDNEALRTAMTLKGWIVDLPDGETTAFHLPVMFKLNQ